MQNSRKLPILVILISASAEDIPHRIFKVILKYKSHPNIIGMKNARNGPGKRKMKMLIFSRHIFVIF